jgi:membrane protein implicated in regulation of membrane protease activity
MSLSDQYDVPKQAPTPILVWLLIGAVIAIAFGLWLVLPDSPLVVALVALVVLGAVFFGVSRILFSRRLERPESSGTHRPGPGRAG